jgi:hypothetical protein
VLSGGGGQWCNAADNERGANQQSEWHSDADRYTGIVNMVSGKGDDWPAPYLKPAVLWGKAPMGRPLLAIVGLAAFLSGACDASAFTTYPVDPVITFDRQADPDQLSDKMSNGQSGGATFGLPGGLPGRFKLQFSGPSSSSTPNSPFVEFPSTVFVPSEHR